MKSEFIESIQENDDIFYNMMNTFNECDTLQYRWDNTNVRVQVVWLQVVCRYLIYSQSRFLFRFFLVLYFDLVLLLAAYSIQSIYPAIYANCQTVLKMRCVLSV